MSSSLPWHGRHQKHPRVPWKHSFVLMTPRWTQVPGGRSPYYPHSMGAPYAGTSSVGCQWVGVYSPAPPSFVRSAQTLFARSSFFLDSSVVCVLRSPYWTARTILRSSESGDLCERISSSDEYPLGFLADAALATFSNASSNTSRRWERPSTLVTRSACFRFAPFDAPDGCYPTLLFRFCPPPRFPYVVLLLCAALRPPLGVPRPIRDQ